ncbi:MAG: thioesterase family protein [Selenomonadaceae bacterium]|nr:thioesterase family protein [Selenomonadaceae bacterium]
MDFPTVELGRTAQVEEEVTEELTALRMKSGSLPVYATPAMAALMENAATLVMAPLLPEGWTSVGTGLDIQHKAPTVVGRKVIAEAKITAMDGRKITFAVRAFDGTSEIGSGVHERFLVQGDKFLAKAEKR